MEVARQANGEREASHSMFDVSVAGVKRHYDLPSYMLRPPGMALAIRYSSSGDYMLIVSTNGTRGLIEVWSTANEYVTSSNVHCTRANNYQCQTT